jgi:hypothetical protein
MYVCSHIFWRNILSPFIPSTESLHFRRRNKQNTGENDTIKSFLISMNTLPYTLYTYTIRQGDEIGENVACTGEVKNRPKCKGLVRKPEETRLCGRHGSRREDNIKVDLNNP